MTTLSFAIDNGAKKTKLTGNPKDWSLFTEKELDKLMTFEGNLHEKAAR